MQQRLNKYLASQGHGSRRAAEKLIVEGRVKVNGAVVTDLATKVTPGEDQVEVSNPVGAHGNAPTSPGYILNKPPGYVTTKSTGEGKTILDLLPADAATMSHAGRLDKDSRGLVLMLADGKLSYQITAPETHLQKRYRVRVEPAPAQSQLDKLRQGVKLDNTMTKAAQVERGSQDKELVITLVEGRNRQIRRMCSKVGLEVVDLRREAIGPLTLGTLKEGTWKPLTQDEVQALARQTGPA